MYSHLLYVSLHFCTDGRIIFNLLNLYTPSTHDEIVNIVTNAIESDPPRKIRVLAAGHSWSHIAQTQDIMISLNDYQGLINVDRENMQVTAKAGTSLRNMSLLLDPLGLAMINLGSVAGQSIAGAISTGECCGGKAKSSDHTNTY